MTTPFEFATAHQIIFGAGKANTIASLARDLGQAALIVVGKSTARVHQLVNEWRALGFVDATLTVSNEPTVSDVLAGTSIARQAGCDFIIAIGGGSGYKFTANGQTTDPPAARQNEGRQRAESACVRFSSLERRQGLVC